MSTLKPPALSGHQKREIAVRAMVDPRTLTRYLRGEAVRPMPAERIRRALAELGHDVPSPSSPPPAPPALPAEGAEDVLPPGL